MKDKIGIGLIGLGTVGSGVADILRRNGELIKRRLGVPVEIVKILRRNPGKPLPAGLSGELIAADIKDIAENHAVDIVVEVMGGQEPAKSYILSAINNGKHVVTANKALLALNGEEIFRAASSGNVDLYFEGSVCGGIPVIKAIREGLAANRIETIYGIVNGTSNYIMTKMTNEGREFSDVLCEAQALGYAEADPSFDVEGIDAAHKLAILASIAYGTPVSFKDIYTEGISGILPVDISYAKEFNYRIKLLAISKMRADDSIEVRVHPTLVPWNHLIATVDDAFNAVYINGDSAGPTLLYGRGAGSLPTGSAVVADIIDISRNILNGGCGKIPPASFKEEMRSLLRILSIDDITSMYYFRFTVVDKPGVLSAISGILGEHNISIESVIQKGRKEGCNVPLVMMTHVACERDVRNALDKIDRLSYVTEKTVMIRVEDGN
ncbi:MAG: homoserine dehydrogenase [Nitrospirae bacterium]|nr:homoserine dehydrogenase [Nitrospirota bacterium]